jgi:hypothetical protein
MCFILSAYHLCIERQEFCRSHPSLSVVHPHICLLGQDESPGIPRAYLFLASLFRVSISLDISLCTVFATCSAKVCCQLSSATTGSTSALFYLYDSKEREPFQGPISLSLTQLEHT